MATDLNDIAKSLGRIETKIETLCQHDRDQDIKLDKLNDKLDNKFNMLPCHHQYELCQADIKKKVNVRVLIAILAILIPFLSGAYMYTYRESHETNEIIRELHKPETIKQPIGDLNDDAVDEN